MPLLLLFPAAAFAHCPLCTAGAGAAAVGAAWLGIGQTSIGIFVGAFSVAMGLWIARLIKKKYIPHQDLLIAIISFVTTVIPLISLMTDAGSVYVGIYGEYGSILHNVYLVNRFFVGSIIGAVILVASPYMSSWIKEKRKGKMIPYQGIAITFLLLSAAALIIEFGL